jgi:DNA-binding beta-propeller fold protein YncE
MSCRTSRCLLGASFLLIALVLAPAGAARALLLGAAHLGNDGPSTLYRIDPATGAATQIGPIGFERCSGMDFFVDTLYAACERSDGSNTHVLITIDPSSGAGTEVGPTGVGLLGFGDTTSDIAFRSDGTLFAYIENNDGVGVIDTTTGAAQSLGSSGVICCGNGIAFPLSASTQTLYHANDVSLNSLDQSAGSATLIAALGFSPPADEDPRVNALDFDLVSGILYASVKDGTRTDRENYLATIDLTTGAVQLLGASVEGLDAIAFVPEPGTGMLLGFGLLGLSLRRRGLRAGGSS